MRNDIPSKALREFSCARAGSLVEEEKEEEKEKVEEKKEEVEEGRTCLLSCRVCGGWLGAG